VLLPLLICMALGAGRAPRAVHRIPVLPGEPALPISPVFRD